jgi:hypothetical protein
VSTEPPAPWGPAADAPGTASYRGLPAYTRPLPPSPPPKSTPRPAYQHPAVVLGSLVLCFPVGVGLVFLTAWNLRTKLIAAGGGTLLAVLLALASAAAGPAPTVSTGAPAPSGYAGFTNVPSSATLTVPLTVPAPTTTVPPTTTPPPPSTARPTKAAPTTAPTAAAKVESKSACHASYTPCVPVAGDVDCAGGTGDGPAYVTGPVRVIGADTYKLDHDRDGVGCEP